MHGQTLRVQSSVDRQTSFDHRPIEVRVFPNTREDNEIMAIRLSHRGICVADIAESLSFYRDGLGFAAAELYEMDDPALSTVMEVPGSVIRAQMVRNAEGVAFELLQFVEPGASGPRERRPNNQYGLTHLAVYVDDIDEAAAKVRAAGGQAIYDHTRGYVPRKTARR